MKRRVPQVVLVLAVTVFASWALACSSQLPGDAVAKVGSTYISLDQFNAAVAQEAAREGITKAAYGDRYDTILKGLQKYIVENLVVNELVTQEAAKLKLTVTDAEVNTELNNYLISYYGNNQSALNSDLTRAGLTMDDFKKNIKNGLLTNKVRAEVVKDVTSVSEAQIAAYYDANKSNYYVQPSRQLRHILIKPLATGTATTTTLAAGSDTTTAGTAAAQVTSGDWATALATAKEVRQKLVAGGDWNKLASQYSDDFETKNKGGDLGTVHQGDTIKQFEDAAFALRLNEISQPVKTVYGYEIIQATGVTIGGQQTLDQVRDQIKSDLLSEAQDAAWNKWVDQKMKEVGVIYRSDLRPAATTTTAEPTTTNAPAGSTTTVAGSAGTTTTTKP